MQATAEDHARMARKRKVKVWNRTNYEYRNEVNGEMVVIPANDWIEVRRREAIAIKGTYYTPKGPRGENLPVRIEVEDNGYTPEQTEYICNRCGYSAQSQDDLTAHILNNHAEDLPKELRETKKAEAEKVRVYACPKCDVAEFDDKEALKAHMRECKKTSK